jgi:flagellar FliJ protein
MDNHNLRMLIELATTARDGAAARQAQVHAQLMQAEAQLQTLRGYVRDYQTRADDAMRQGCDIAAQGNQRAFVARLERAIVQQADEVQRRTRLLEAAAAEVAQFQRKLKSLEALAQRKLDAQRTAEERREQKTLAEVARQASAAAPLARNAW